jgi:hypothetical protein
MLDTSGDPVYAIAYGDVTVTYKKFGDAAWSVKTVGINDWSAQAAGRYLLLFSADELDTDGTFVFRVAESGSDTFTGDFDLTSNWTGTTDMMIDLLNGLSSKVSQESASTAQRLTDESIETLSLKWDEYDTEIVHLQRQIATLQRTIAGL